MRLRTKLFLTWAGIILVLWAGAFWWINRVISLRINQMAQDAFTATQRGLEGMQQERFARMQQAGRLFNSIPELRALIAEANVELTAENRVSLRDRLNDLSKLVDVGFVSVLDRGGQEIAHSAQSPWTNSDQWLDYCHNSPQAMALLKRVFEGSTGAANSSEFGLWPCQRKLYQVVVVPLRFNSGPDAEVLGALVFGEPITNYAARLLGQSHNSDITFFCEDQVVASGLTPAGQMQIAQAMKTDHWPDSQPFVFGFAGTEYHGSLQPVLDPASGTIVGRMLIQCDQQDASVNSSISRSLILIMLSGLALAAITSFVTSSAITRPVQQLVEGVQRVAGGELKLSLPISGGELGELARAFNDMVSQIRSRRELELQYEAAQSASRAKSQFLANMSHEIRTPLNGVIGMTELLIGTPLTDQQRRYAAMAKTSAELLTTQINDILDLSKIEAGKLEIESIDFNLHETVEAVVDLLCEKAMKKKLELACSFHADVPRAVRGDPDRLRQILVNLINNAIKFTSSGGVVVRVEPHAESADASIVRFSVADSGIGIPADRIDRLFKPFSQVDASTTRKFGGTGLGLAICKQLAELMGGSIGVQSEIERGSTFWFTLKLEKPLTPPQTSGSTVPFEPDSIRVLAIDDSQTTCNVLQQQFASWGVHADTICAAADALGAMRQALAAGKPYKMVLIDSDMPGTSGFELARLIKSDSQLCKTILMALLPFESSLRPSQLLDAGFSGHMTKPVRQSQLFDGLMRAVARQHARSSRAEPEPTAPAAPAPVAGNGARILIAEDNEVNQLVVVELLTRSGYRCEVVDNGIKAVEAAMSGGCDLVLMDCQMPEMDGFEASRIIRQKEATCGQSRHIPIIALTANAIKGDREQCLQAGMDGYCTKPLDAKQLLAQIETFLKRPAPASSQPEQPPAEVTVSPTPTEGPSQRPAIIVDTLLERCMNNLSTIERVVSKFEQQSKRDAEQIRKSLEGSDATAAMRAAHSLKGAAGIVAAEGIASVAAEIERFGREQQIDLMNRSLSRLDEEVRRCIAYLPHVRTMAKEKLSSAATAPPEVRS